MSTHEGVFGIPHGILNSVDEVLPYLVAIAAAYFFIEKLDNEWGIEAAILVGLAIGLVLKTGLEMGIDPA